MLEAGLLVSRFLQYTATLVIFGISIFPLYTYPESTGALPQVHRSMQATMWWAALAALVSAVFWFASVTGRMTGRLGGVLNPDAVWSVLSDTSFGKVWIVRFILAAIILVLLSARRAQVLTARLRWLVPTLCAGLLVSLAGVGHTQVDDGIARVIHVSADGLHLLAAGAWLGGLVSLFYLVARAIPTYSLDDDAEVCNAAIRFSGMGYIAVATLIGSGLINSWFLLGSFGNLGTPYGQLLIAKLALFAGMVGLAALNRFCLIPRSVKAIELGVQAAGLMRLRHHILGEQSLGLLVILIVSALGTMEPAINP